MKTEEATHWEANAAVFLFIFQWIAPCHWHIIDDPMMLVIQAHALPQRVQSFFSLGITFWIRFCAYLTVGIANWKKKVSKWSIFISSFDKMYFILYTRKWIDRTLILELIIIICIFNWQLNIPFDNWYLSKIQFYMVRVEFVLRIPLGLNFPPVNPLHR